LWDVPPVPLKGYSRIFIVAYDGPTVSEGVYEQLIQYKMGNAAITVGSKLMKAMTKKHKNKDSVTRYAF
jgi:hypothetical protein